MLNQNFIILGVIISFLGSMSYLIDTLKGKVKPNRISWFMWGLAPMIAFIAELEKGVGLQALMTFMAGVQPLLIFIASFINKKSVWKLTRFDFMCGLFSLLGLLFWSITKEANIAIIFSIFADGIAGIPTIVKSFSAPETENYHGFLASTISAGITLLTIKTWTIANYGFPLYIFIICLFLTVLIKYNVGKLLQKSTKLRTDYKK